MYNSKADRVDGVVVVLGTQELWIRVRFEPATVHDKHGCSLARCVKALVRANEVRQGRRETKRSRECGVSRLRREVQRRETSPIVCGPCVDRLLSK
jgi:hypothetical protein